MGNLKNGECEECEDCFSLSLRTKKKNKLFYLTKITSEILLLTCMHEVSLRKQMFFSWGIEKPKDICFFSKTGRLHLKSWDSWLSWGSWHVYMHGVSLRKQMFFRGGKWSQKTSVFSWLVWGTSILY